MRVVRIEGLDDPGGDALELHPQLTVVRGLPAGARSRLVDAVGRLPGGLGTGVRGELEVAGVLLPYTEASFGLLDIGGPHDAVVDGPRLGAAGRTASPGDAVASDDVAAEVDGEARADEAADAPAPVDDPAPVAARPGPNRLERRISALRSRRAELARLLDGIERVDVAPVAEALAGLEAAPVGVPVAAAAELADAWADLQKDLQGLEVGTTPDERVAMVAVARAQEAVAEAEAILRQPQLTEEQIRRIEAAHAAYIEASDKVERRFGGGRARKQLAEAEAEEQRLLSRFGYGSWVDYMLDNAKRAADPDMNKEKADLEAAQLELEVCIAELDAIPGAVGRRRRRARLRERQEELSDRIADVLGHQPVGDGVEAELRGLTIPYEPVAEVRALVRAIEAVGAEPPARRTDRDAVEAAARHLVAAEAHAERRRSELEVAVEALDEALLELEVALEEGGTEVPDMAPLPDMAEPPVGLLDLLDGEDEPEGPVADEPEPSRDRRGSDGAHVRSGPGDQPDPALVDGEAEDDDEAAGVAWLFESTGRPAAVDASGAGRDPSVTFLPEDLGDRAALVDSIHWEAMRFIAASRAEGPAGQLPVVFDDPFGLLDPDECVELLARLARLTDHVQVVVVTDRPEVAEWASAVGDEHARVVERS